MRHSFAASRISSCVVEGPGRRPLVDALTISAYAENGVQPKVRIGMSCAFSFRRTDHIKFLLRLTVVGRPKPFRGRAR